MNKKYIFDLDGTLIDASERLYRLFQYLVPESKLTKEEYWSLKRDKINHQMILERYFPKYLFDDFNSKWLSLIEQSEYLNLDCLYIDTIEVLEKLSSENELILLTARQSKENLYKELEKLGIKQYFSHILVTENKCTKEDLLKQISFDGQDYFVSDMGKDIAIGNKVGLRTIAITHGFMNREKLEEYEPWKIIGNLEELTVELNCLYAYNAAICLRKAIGTVIDDAKNLLNIPIDKYYIAFCEDYKIIDKTSLCLTCEGCLDFTFLTKIWFHYIEELDRVYNNERNFIDKLLNKFHVPEELWEKYYFIMSLSDNNEFLFKNYPDINKEILERVSTSAKTAYQNLKQAYYSNLISDCNDKVLRIYDVLSERNLNYCEVNLKEKKIVYFDTNVFSDYVNNKSFNSLVNLSKSNDYTYVYSPFVLEDGIKSDRIHFLYDCNKLVELTDNKTILPIDDTFLIKREDVFECSKRVHLFRDYTQAQEEKNVYKKKFFDLTFLPMPDKKRNTDKINKDFICFFKNDVSKNDELYEYMAAILYQAEASLELSDIIDSSIKYSNLSKVVDGLFRFFDYLGYASDSKEKTLRSSVQDLEHVKSATASDIFVTSDEKLYKRATVIYTLLGIKTKVMKEDDFKQILIPKGK